MRRHRRSKHPLTLALVGALAVTLTACSSEGGTTTGTGGDMDTAGVLVAGYPLQAYAVHFDPTLSTVASDSVWMTPVFGTLLRQQENGTLTPWMAQSAEVVDPQSVKITLRPGMKFTDGTAFDATAVRTSLMRTTKPASPAAQGALNPVMKDLVSVDVVDPLIAVARLNQPVAGQFLTELSQRSGSIQSPKQIAENPGEIDTKPIGAGPFTLVGSSTSQKLTYTKNPAFWDAANIKLGGIQIIDAPFGPQQVNGLLAGTMDFAPFLSQDVIATLAGAGKYTTHISDNFTVELAMCTDKAPFDNEAFRQAIQLGIDRQKFGDRAYGGKVTPATSYLREDNPAFNPATKDVVKFDPNKAKALLASAGAAGVPFDLHYPAVQADLAPAAEVLQAQLRDVGVATNIVPDRDLVAGFITPKAPGAMIFATIGTFGAALYPRHFGPGGFFALCGVDRPDVMAAVNGANGLAPDDPKAIAAMKQAQDLMAEHAYAIPITTYASVSGWNKDKVGGEPKYTSDGYLQFDSVYIKKP